MKKLLIYNWDHVDGNLGSGVTVYVKNLMIQLLNNTEYELYYLNSGLTYTKDKEVKVVRVENNISDKINTFEILNSPVIAPVTQSEENIKAYLTDNILYNVFIRFVKENNISIIHFNNIEGLSLKCLQIKKYLPKVKVLYSAHNYSAICTRTNLWMDERHEGHNCDKRDYRDCVNCYKQISYHATVMYRRYFLRNKLLHRPSLKILSCTCIKPKEIDIYEKYTANTVECINTFDRVLAVSERVSKILQREGILPSVITTSYIGSETAEFQMGKCTATHSFDDFTIIYMGYMSEAKGFKFFAKSMQRLAVVYPETAKNINIRIVAKFNKDAGKSLDDLKGEGDKFKTVSYINGYSRNNQKQILSDVNLGIVPVMWEDNLPQVAIEQVAYGVPILVSNLGGAQEICNNSQFVFSAGDENEFINKLINIYHNQNLLDEFFYTSMKLVTMQEHIQELERFYAE